MAGKKLQDLLVDILKEDQLWFDLHAIIHDYTEESQTQYIRVLENIRSITQDTDQDLIDDSIRQLGLDIHQDIMEVNGKNIRRMFYQLSKFYKINGNIYFPKFVEFLLGRGFDVENLYTQNYVDFSPTPGGPLNIDGGPWFMTSHVNLIVEGSGLAEYLSINLGAGDIKYVRKRLDYDKKTEAEKIAIDAMLTDLMSRELNVVTDDQEVVEALVDLRISELFYKFAPINEVIKDIYFGMYAQAKLYISMSAMEYPRIMVQCDSPSISQMKIVLPNMVSASREYDIKVQVKWSDDTVTLETPTALSDTEGLLSSARPAIFNDPAVGISAQTTVIASLFGQQLSKNVMVLAYGIPLKPDEIYIKGLSTLISEGSDKYILMARTGNLNFEVEDTENILWALTPGPASLAHSTVTFDRLVADTTVTLSAIYTAYDGTPMATNKAILGIQNLLRPIPVSMTPRYTQVILDSEDNIISEGIATNFIQGNTYKIYVDVLYSDGTTVTEGFYVESKNALVSITPELLFEAPVVGEDFTLVLDYGFADGEEQIAHRDNLMLEFPKIELQSIDIEGPGIVKEGQVAMYRAIANWSNGARSIITDAIWSSTDTLLGGELVKGVPIDEMGRVQFPAVGFTGGALIRAQSMRYTDAAIISTQRVVEITNAVRSLSSLDIISAEEVFEGTFIGVHNYAMWTDGGRTEILPDSVEIWSENGTSPIATAVRSSPNTMTYTSSGQIVLGDHESLTFVDGETGETCSVLAIKYVAGPDKVTGIHSIIMRYSSAGIAAEQIRSFVAVPNIVKAEAISYTLIPNIPEGTRRFVTVIARYEDGTDMEVEAKWLATDLEGETDDLPIEIVSGSFTLPALVEALTGLDEQTIIDMAINNENLETKEQMALINGDTIFENLDNRPIAGQTWPAKLGILYAQYEGIVLPRMMLQTRYIDEDEPFALTCEFYALSLQSDHVVINAPIQAHDKINSWYISGPVEIQANEAQMYSYSLVVDYDDEGEEYAVSSDWELDFYRDDGFDQQRELIRYLVDVEGKSDILPMASDGSGTRLTVDQLNAEEMEDILPIARVLDVDQDGYLYPRMNVNARVVLKTIYNDGISTFEETLNLYMQKINSKLLGLDMLLLDPIGQKTYAFGNLIKDEPNSWSNTSLDGALYYQLAVELRRAGAALPETPPNLVLWRAEPTGNGVSFDEASGRLYVAPQNDDTPVVLIASYSEEFRETEETSEITSETVEARYSINIYAHRALDIITLTGNDYTTDDTVFYPTVEVRRRNNTLANIFEVLSWEIVSAPNTITREGNYGFVIPKLSTDAQMTLRAVAKEGTRIITRDFVFNLLAGFVPEELLVDSNPTGHRDNSNVQLNALLKVRNNPVPLNVNQQAYWLLDTQIPGLSIGNRTGILTIPKLDKDTEIKIRVVYSEGNLAQPEKTIVLMAQSSYPIYWTGEFNVINTTYFNLILDNEEFLRLPNDKSGRFTALPNSNEYLYFANVKAYGNARFSLVPSTSEPVNWGNMQAGVDVVRTYLNGATETWTIYRSVNRGFGNAEFSVSFG